MKKVFVIVIFFVTLCFFTNSIKAQEVKIYRFEGDSIIVEAQRERPIPKFSNVATKLYTDLQKTPFSLGVVNNSLITNQNNSNLGEALKNISGVNTQTGFGVHDYFIIRGLNSLDNSLILTDGTPEPEVTYYNLYNVERLELLKGPGAFLYGSNSLSGTVNIVRKQALFQNFIKVQTGFGQFATTRNSIDAGMSNINIGLASRINILYEKSDNYRKDKSNKVLAINPVVTWLLQNQMTLNLNFEYIISNYKPDSGIPLLYDPLDQQLNKIPDIPSTTSFQTPFDFSDQNITRVKLNFDKKFNQLLSFQSKAYYTHLDWQSKGTLLNGAFPNESGQFFVSRSLSELEDVRNLFGIQNEVILTFSTGAYKHNLVTGFEWKVLQEEYRYDIAPLIPEIDLLAADETAVENQIIMYPFLRGKVTNEVISPYIMDRISISDKLQVTVGLRYDIIKFENKAEGYLTNRSYSNLNPLFAVNFSPVPALTFYANGSRAYAPPSSQVIGEKKAERSRQFEIGVKQRYFDELMHLDIAYYNLKKDNIAIPGTDGISKQLGDQLSKGLEVDISIEPVNKWFTFISYTYSDINLTKYHEKVTVGSDEFGRPIEFVFDRSGNSPAFTPQHMFNIWSTKEFENGFGLGGGLRYWSEQFIDEDNVFKIDKTFILNANIHYKLHNWKLGLHVKNISSEKYYLRGFGASSLIPANPRTLYFQLNFSI